jgi:hypothetical protein
MPNVDLHEIRSSLKLIRGSGESTLFENRGGAPCPVCGEVFDEVLETTERTRQFTPPHRIGFCLVNESDRVVLFTHA